jgi:hypothetical protein
MSSSTDAIVGEWIRNEAISFSPDAPDSFNAAAELGSV